MALEGVSVLTDAPFINTKGGKIMIELKLDAKTNEEKRIKQYLEENASETLADKINNGVRIIKNDKELINKKDLAGFMNYASSEARKLVNNNAKYACIEDTTVFGWAIHYFEEDSIEGKLYNPDGTENNQEVKSKQKETKPVIKENPQQNMFDLMLNIEEPKHNDNIKPVRINQNLIVDKETGIIEASKPLNKSYDEQITIMLCSLLGDNLEVK